MAADPLKIEEAYTKRNKLKKEKPYVYEKVMKFEEKLKRGRKHCHHSVSIQLRLQFYLCPLLSEKVSREKRQTFVLPWMM